NILHTRLSILPEEATVEDFANDLEVLYTSLKNWQGGTDERLYNAFIKEQAIRIKAMFQAPDVATEAGKELHDTLTEDVLTASWNDRDDAPKFTFYGPVVRLSLIDVLSHDLQLAGL